MGVVTREACRLSFRGMGARIGELCRGARAGKSAAKMGKLPGNWGRKIRCNNGEAAGELGQGFLPGIRLR
jgi:hypothetical protein